MFLNPYEPSRIPLRKASPAVVCHRVAIQVTVASIAFIGCVHPFLPAAPIWPDSPITLSQLVITPLAVAAAGGFVYALVSSLRQ